jgi:trehalose 6-phosphate phosphatase
VSPAPTLVEALGPLRSEPTRSAVLLDIDGTLAPIVRHADDAHVPEATRSVLIEVSRRYGVVGCISGRRAATARAIVAIGTISYVGNHGGELLRAGSTAAEIDPNLVSWTDRISAFAASSDTPERRRLRVRFEDKGPIAAFHWRGAPDEEEAEGSVREIAETAQQEGFGIHWGRKVLEVRPPVEFDKGVGVTALLDGADVSAAIYVGDDTTDLDAFRGLRSLADEGRLQTALCIAVGSEEAPAELTSEADLTVDGPPGVRGLLEALL